MSSSSNWNVYSPKLNSKAIYIITMNFFIVSPSWTKVSDPWNRPPLIGL